MAKKKRKHRYNNWEGLERPTRHHLIPSSRGGTNDEKNIKIVPEKDHRAWHQIFENFTPSEIIKMLEIFGPEIFLRNQKPKKEAWKRLFDTLPVEKVIEIIKTEWSPKSNT